MNPNLPLGVSENTERARGRQLNEAPILPEPGNVWPGPPQPLPTLNQVSREQTSDLSGGTGGGHGGPLLHDGGSMSLGESNSISQGVTPGADSFAGGGVLSGDAPGGQAPGDPAPDASSRHPARSGADKSGDIVIPNGDGTSTVIGPDGTVKTVRGTPK